MAKKTDGITELTKMLKMLAGHLTFNEYQKVQSVVFALLNGVTFGYNEMGPRFIHESEDVYYFHNGEAKPISKKTKNNPQATVVIENKSKDNVVDLNHYRFWNKV